jgi:general secretion pathway protein H
MPKSARGNNLLLLGVWAAEIGPRFLPPTRLGRRVALRGLRRGFTLIELLVVMAIVAIAAGLVIVSLPDRQQGLLDEEAERLSALLESARTEARASGIAVHWTLAGAEASDGADFRFIGLPTASTLPTQWLARGVSAEVIGARAVLLGPEPVLPPQRIVLRLQDRRVVLASDGLAPFAPAPAP